MINTVPIYYNNDAREFCGRSDFDRSQVTQNILSFPISVIQDYFVFGNDINVLKGKITSLALTQAGSRFLQKQLAKTNPALIYLVLQEIKGSLSKLMVDDYGNYFCQKLISICSPFQRLSLISEVVNSVVKISMNKKGTYAIQTILNSITIKDEEKIMSKNLKGHISELSCVLINVNNRIPKELM